MDPNVRDLLIAALPIIGGVLVGILVAKITADRTRQLEREKWKRELYATFIHSATEVRDAVHLIASREDPDDGWGAYIGKAQQALVEIRMIAPAMRGPADAVWDAAGKLMRGLPIVTKPEPDGTVVMLDRTQYNELDEACRAANEAFVDRASREFGSRGAPR